MGETSEVKAIGQLLVHIASAAIGFVGLFLIALSLSKFTGWVESLMAVPALVIEAMHLVEKILLFIDIMVFFYVVIVKVMGFIAEIWSTRKG
jgi:hypothetical protein